MGDNSASKVLIVGPTPPPYHGVTESTKRLLNSPLQKHFKLIHLDTSDHRDITNIGTIDFINLWLAFKNLLTLIFYCVRYQPDLVYIPISQTWVGYARDGLFVLIVKWFGGSRVLIHLRGGYFGQFYSNANPLVKWFVNFTMRRIDRVIVLGECFRSIFSHWFSPEAIDVVPNGTDFSLPDVNKKFQRSPSKNVTITFISGLMRTKGILDFIKAAKSALKEEPKTQFMVGGEWWESNTKDEAMRLINENRLQDHVNFLGLVTGSEKMHIMEKTDIFVLPTYYPFEGHPNVVVEAMAAGCPVISTPHAAIPETVIDGETGLLIPPKSPEKLAEAMIRLIHDSDLRLRMARNSYKRYKEYYTLERNIELLTESFRRSLDG